jgi:hypothetical protein
MLARLAVLALVMAAAAGCATAKPDEPVSTRPTTFESWSACNATGGFFCALGPAGGTGVRWAWPQ